MYSPYLQFPSVCEVQYDADECSRTPYRLPSSSGRGGRLSHPPRTAVSGGGLRWLPRISRSGRLSVQLIDGETAGGEGESGDVDSYGYGFGYGYGYGYGGEGFTEVGRLAKSAPNFAGEPDGWPVAYGDDPDVDEDRRRRQRDSEDAGRQMRIQFNLTQQQQQQQLLQQLQDQSDRRRLQSQGGGRYSTSRLTNHSLYSSHVGPSTLGFKSLNDSAYMTEQPPSRADEASPPLAWIDDLRKWIEVREDTSYLTFVNRAQLGANPKSRQGGDDEELDAEGADGAHDHRGDEMCDRFLHHFNLAQERRDDLAAAKKASQRRRDRPRRPIEQGPLKQARGKLWKEPPPPPPRPKPKRIVVPPPALPPSPPSPPSLPKRRDTPELPPTEPMTAVEVAPPPPAPPPPSPPPPPPPPREPPPAPSPSPTMSPQESTPPAMSPSPKPSSSPPPESESEVAESPDDAPSDREITESETETAKSTTEVDSEASYRLKSEADTATSDQSVEAPPTLKPPSPTPIVAPAPRVLRQIQKKVKIAPKKMVVQYTERKVHMASAREESVDPGSDQEDGGSSKVSFLTASTPPPLPPVPEPEPHEHPQPLKPESDMPLKPRIPRDMYKRWGAKRVTQDRELEAERARLAELRKQKAEEISSRLRKLIPTGSMAGDGPNYEEYGWLAKYCILNRVNVQMFTGTFQAVDMEERGFLGPEDVLIALKAVNSQLTEAEELYIFRVLEMCGYRLKAGADCKLFCVIAALSQRITSLDTWMRNAINEISYKILDMKLFLCKSLWESCVPNGLKTMNVEQLAIELLAGGVADKHIEEVRVRLGPTREFDLLDFLTYIPLFILLHTSIVDNPLSTVRDK